ncbi:Lipoprotein LipO precursor [compost metagenome]
MQGEERASKLQLFFQDMQVYIPTDPRLVQETMMVPAQPLLEGFGYQIEWDPAKGQLIAKHLTRPTLTFWTDRSSASINGNLVHDLPAAPFLEDDTLWIPLRLAAEASGMEVAWQPVDRMAMIRDPHALPKFRVSTRADNGSLEAPAKLQAYMQTEWKTDVRFQLLPSMQYRDRTNVMIASGDTPDLMLIEQPYQYKDELFSSFATDLTDMLESFPRLKALATDGSPSNRSINNRIYGIARPSDSHDAAFPAIRKDWLDKLGLMAPTTMEDLYKVLLDFVQKDPDGNGKKDSIGFTGTMDRNGLGSLAWVEQAFTGSPGRFIVKEGQVQDTAVSQQERLALQWLARAYAEGLIDKEFAVLSESQVTERLNQGHTGLAALTVNQAAQLTVEKETDTNKLAWWVPLAGLKANASSAAIAPWNQYGSGLYIIPRNVSPDKAVKILTWLDRGIEMRESGQWEKASGLTESDHAAVANLFGQSGGLTQGETLKPLSPALRAPYQESIKAWQAVTYKGASLPQANLIWSNGDYADINSKLEQLKVKFIMGALSIEQWDQHVEKLVTSEGYRSMMKKLNELVQ